MIFDLIGVYRHKIQRTSIDELMFGSHMVGNANTNCMSYGMLLTKTNHCHCSTFDLQMMASCNGLIASFTSTIASNVHWSAGQISHQWFMETCTQKSTHTLFLLVKPRSSKADFPINQPHKCTYDPTVNHLHVAHPSPPLPELLGFHPIAHLKKQRWFTEQIRNGSLHADVQNLDILDICFILGIPCNDHLSRVEKSGQSTPRKVVIATGQNPTAQSFQDPISCVISKTPHSPSTTKQPTNQPTNQPIKQPTSQPANQSAHSFSLRSGQIST